MRRPRFLPAVVIMALLANGVFLPSALAQQINLPSSRLIQLGPAFKPSLLKGITVHPDNPFQFDFIVGLGDDHLSSTQLREASQRFIKYFLASLTVPEDQQWVNLSPYEQQRIIPESLGTTDMGRDLLAQDYILKQITASLMYPENELGKKFWQRIYKEAAGKFGTTNIAVNTFNKVWIMPDKVLIYEHGSTAMIVENRLKVMLEQDYLALSRHSERTNVSEESKMAFQVVREVILPALEREVNEGKNFAQLRQIYSAMLLATWYKIRLKESILSRKYVDQNKVTGVDISDKQAKLKIYEQYLNTFKKGVFNFIKEEQDPATGQIIPRKYFAGGTKGYSAAMVAQNITRDAAQLGQTMPSEASLLVEAELRETLMSENSNSGEILENRKVQRYSIQGVTVEIPQELTGFIPQALVEKFAATAAGKTKGLRRMGRSYIIPLAPAERFSFDIQGQPFETRSDRLKGTNYNGSKPKPQDYIDDKQPTHVFRIVELGSDEIVMEERKAFDPQGMLKLKKATQEFEIMEEIVKAGLPTAFPIGIGRYDGIKHNGDDVGFLILAEPSDPVPPRLGTALTQFISGRLVPQSRFASILQAFSQAASLLERFHEKGFIHTYPHLDQFDYDHGAVRRIYDFTGSESARDMSRNAFMLRALVDLARLWVSAYGILPDAQKVSTAILSGYLSDEMGAIQQNQSPAITILAEIAELRSQNGKKVKEVLSEFSEKSPIFKMLMEKAGKNYDSFQSLGKTNRLDLLESAAANNAMTASIQIAPELQNVLPAALLRRIPRVATAAKTPKDMTYFGRSRILPLTEQLKFNIGLKRMNFLRLKYVTYKGEGPQMEPYVPGPDDTTVSSFKIAERNGRIFYQRQPVMPKGTTYLSEVKKEYRLTKTLFEAGVPVPFPVGVGEFDAKFLGGKLGFLALAEERNPASRLGTIFFKRFTEFINRFDRREEIDEQEYLNSITEFGNAVEQAAQLLRQVVEAGIVHAQPHLDQFGYDEESKKIYAIYDFEDASRAAGVSRARFIVYFIKSFLDFYDSINGIADGIPSHSQKQLDEVLKIYDGLLKEYFKPEERGPLAFMGDDIETYQALQNFEIHASEALINLEGMTWGEALKRLTDGDVLTATLAEVGGKIYDKKRPPRKSQPSQRQFRENLNLERWMQSISVQLLSRFDGLERLGLSKSESFEQRRDSLAVKLKTFLLEDLQDELMAAGFFMDNKGSDQKSLMVSIVDIIENNGPYDIYGLKDQLLAALNKTPGIDDSSDEVKESLVQDIIGIIERIFEEDDLDILVERLTANEAMLAEPGGIDLNPADLKMNIQTDKAMPVVQAQDWDKLDIQGLYPVIIKIAPTTDLPARLGLNGRFLKGD